MQKNYDVSVNKYKSLICASTNAIYTFDTYIMNI